MRQEFLPHFFVSCFCSLMGLENDAFCQHPHPHPHWHRQHPHRCLYLYRYRVCRKSGVRLCPDCYPNPGYVWRLYSPLSAALLFWTVALHGFVSGQGRGLGYSEKGSDWLLDWVGLGCNFLIVEVAARVFCPYMTCAFFCSGARVAIADIQVGTPRTASLYRSWPLA